MTNKHVVKNALSGQLILSLCDDKNNYLAKKTHTHNITEFEKAWIFHPDANVDLCVLPIHQFYKEFRPSPYNLYMTYITERDFPTKEEIQEYSHIEDVTIIGYPDSL